MLPTQHYRTSLVTSHWNGGNVTINADGEIVHSNDLSVNESTSNRGTFVFKSEKSENKIVSTGTLASD
jgi:hypothetical protein